MIVSLKRKYVPPTFKDVTADYVFETSSQIGLELGC